MKKKRIIIIGAGVAGKLVAHDILYNSKISGLYEISGFLDDHQTGIITDGIRVIGTIVDATSLIKEYRPDEVIIAIPSADYTLINRIVRNVGNTGVTIKIVPGIYEIIKGSVKFSQVREIDPVDLLGREEIDFEVEELAGFYHNLNIMVTGAGGSIGSEIVRQLLLLPVKSVIVIGRGENSIHSLLGDIHGDNRIIPIIGDVRDRSKIAFVTSRYKPDIVFHAAAHKHVPFMEDNPDEAIKNNIIGTYNCASESLINNVKKFVLVSTDKSVKPSSVMGMSKSFAEKIILSMNEKQQTRFQAVRFGNVLGSRGSVIPVFNKQIENGGPVTVTDPEMTRYFMSIREAARLVVKSATINDGDIYILDMGKPIKIVDLARSLISLHGYNEDQIGIVFTGVRKGEKLHEELASDNEDLCETKYQKLMVLSKDRDRISLSTADRIIEFFLDIGNIFDEKTLRDALFNNQLLEK